jgi:polyisoprenoid-binding protein YceI
VSIQPGTYRLGPAHGTLWLRTGRTGAAAKAGHDLLIHVTSWEGRLEVGEDPAGTSIELDVDATSLRVREGRGGMQALGEDDRANIEQTIDGEILQRRDIHFRSTRVEPAADGSGFSVIGDLTLLGATRPIGVGLAVADGALGAVAVVRQTEFGITPYSTLYGALKVVDEVRVGLDARLPSAGVG